MNKPLALVAVFAALMMAAPVFAAVSSAESDNQYVFIPYYEQLDANGKAIYNAVTEAGTDDQIITVDLPVAISTSSNGTNDATIMLENLVKEMVDAVFVAMKLCSPLSYWGWGPSAPSYSTNIAETGGTATVSSITLEVSFGNYPIDPEASEVQVVQKMIDDLNAAVESFSTSSTDIRGKVLDINNHLTNLVTYDPDYGVAGKESKYDHDAYGALASPNHYAVCDGYSKAFLLLCQKEGIDCAVVFGTGMPQYENHAWNYVKMDNGKWYAMDVTWNDGTDNRYFLMGGEEFFLTHQQGVYLGSNILPYTFMSPVISGTPYDDTADEGFPAYYAWILAIVIVAIVMAALYRHSK